MIDKDLPGSNLNNPSGQNESRISRVPALVYPYSVGVIGGLWGGLAMVPVALVYGIVSGRGVWYPVNLIAATVLRSWQRVPLDQLMRFSFGGLAAGLLIHLLMCVVLGLIFATLLPTLPGSPIFWAFVVGPILWAGAIFAGLPLVNPVMAQHVDWLSFAIANIVYSLVLGLWVARSEKISAA
jgi:hypothetical protein